MKKSLLLIPVTIALVIFFYPTTSNSNSTGSVGGKTGSPTDGVNCTQCHGAQQGQGATITTDIPSTGYEPGNIYNITATMNSGLGFGDPKGFEFEVELAEISGSETLLHLTRGDTKLITSIEEVMKFNIHDKVKINFNITKVYAFNENEILASSPFGGSYV